MALLGSQTRRRGVSRNCSPVLEIAGTACPPQRGFTVEQRDALLGQIREASPHLLFLAFGQPKGERWIDAHLDQLGVPVSVQIGCSLEFVAGRVPRAPLWLQRVGLEWTYRMALEPRRLFPRYALNGVFAMKMAVLDLLRVRRPAWPAPTDQASSVSVRPEGRSGTSELTLNPGGAARESGY